MPKSASDFGFMNKICKWWKLQQVFGICKDIAYFNKNDALFGCARLFKHTFTLKLCPFSLSYRQASPLISLWGHWGQRGQSFVYTYTIFVGDIVISKIIVLTQKNTSSTLTSCTSRLSSCTNCAKKQ